MKFKTYFMFFSILFLFVYIVSIPMPTNAGTGRFFIMGDGSIHIKNAKTGKEAQVNLLTHEGRINNAAFEKIDEIFNFPTKEKGEHISARLIFMLDYFSDIAAPGKIIIIESGYRNPEYNTKLRSSGRNAAKTSTHLDGMAADFFIEGVDGKNLWEIIRQHQCCGAGHYGGNTVHLDAARPRFWEASTSKVHTGESDYNRRIYLSSDFDRYKAGDTVRLSFSSVSDFGFGIKRILTITDGADGESPAATASLIHSADAGCIMINDRKSSRFLFFQIPGNLNPGKYKIRADFCEKPFEQMPDKTLSNDIEIVVR